MTKMRKRTRRLGAALLAISLGTAARASELALTPSQTALTAGATVSLAVGARLDVPLGGYLFELSFDTRAFSLVSLVPAAGGEFAREFFVNGTAFAGLNDASLTAPSGSAPLGLAVFRVTDSTAALALVDKTTVTVAVREAVGTMAQALALAPASAVFMVARDTAAPETTIVFTPPPAGADAEGRPLLSTGTLAGFAAEDGGTPASGVAATLFSVDGGTQTAFTAPFALEPGSHTVAFASRDNAGNLEPERSTAVFVGSPDQTRPETALVLAGPQFLSGSALFASSSTLFGFFAVDPASGAAQPSGVAVTEFRVDAPTGAFTAFRAAFTLEEGGRLVDFRSVDNAGNVEVTKSSAVTIDATPPASRLEVAGPRFTGAAGLVFVSTASEVGFAAEDAGAGVAVTEFRVDPGSATPFERYAATFTVAEGLRALEFRSRDNVDNLEVARSTTLASDGSPPLSEVRIGLPRAPLADGAVLVSSRTPLLVVSSDPVSNGVAAGVAYSFVAADTTTFSPAGGEFTLSGPDGEKTIRFFAQDNVLNVGLLQSTVAVLDSRPPALALTSPGPEDGGVCLVLEGNVLLRGSVSDPHLRGYRLEAAPGRGATAGFVLISSGTADAAGMLASWDTGALGGFHTLRLSAADRVENAAQVSRDVFVGDPGRLLVLGGQKTFEAPSGAAVGPDGGIYVADTGNDRIRVFDAAGVHRRSLGKSKKLKAEPFFDAPRGVAVDVSSAVYVADTGHHRVVKLSEAGVILLEIGRSRVKRGVKHFEPGGGPGQFKRPEGVALGADGAIHVADTGNRRVQVFDGAGRFLRQFAMPPVPADAGEDDDDDDDEEEDRLGSPVGIAVDAASNVYVADRAGGRALKFDASGALALTIPGLKRPEGIAVSGAGGCILVSDRGLDRVRKYDAAGRLTLEFGAKGEIRDHKPLPDEIVFKNPAGLALDASGSLFVADPGNDRVQKFGLPGGPTVLASAPPEDRGNAGFRTQAKESAAPAPEAAAAVVGRAGGRVLRGDKAEVLVPEGALDEDFELVISPAEGADGAGYAVSPAVELGPHGLLFDRPVALSLPFDPALAAQSGVREADLRVHYWNPARGDWEPLASALDAGRRVVSAETTHFSLYQVRGPGTGQPLLAAAAADASFAFRDLYAFPNPARRGAAPTLRLQAGVADSVGVNVYDVSGQLVHSAALGRPVVLDDGNGKGPQWTYDYAWDVGGVGSGVYVYVVTAKKAGNADIRRIERVAVIK